MRFERGSGAPFDWSKSSISAALVALGTTLGCAGGAASSQSARPLTPVVEPRTVDGSALCANVGNRFVGLPDIAETPSVTGAASVSVGRWWVRRCAAEPRGAEIEVRLSGPGWYWVDRRASGLRVRQQVPFELQLELRGALHLESSERMLALYLEPHAEPHVEAQATIPLDAHAENGWGTLLRLLPGVATQRQVTANFEVALSDAFRSRLSSGVTFTFDLRTGQADAAVGRLEPGRKPPHPFAEDDTWIVNERLRLPPSALQVLGPIEPGENHLDVIVEQGPGVSYRALCDRAVETSFASLASGKLADVPPAASVVAGEFTGLGERTAELRVPDCRFYLVTATLSDAPTVASVRVRPPA